MAEGTILHGMISERSEQVTFEGSIETRRSHVAVREVSWAQGTGSESTGRGAGRWVLGWSSMALGERGASGGGGQQLTEACGPWLGYWILVWDRSCRGNWRRGMTWSNAYVKGSFWVESISRVLVKAEMLVCKHLWLRRDDSDSGWCWRCRGVGPWVCLTVKPTGIAMGWVLRMWWPRCLPWEIGIVFLSHFWGSRFRREVKNCVRMCKNWDTECSMAIWL